MLCAAFGLALDPGRHLMCPVGHFLAQPLASDSQRLAVGIGCVRRGGMASLSMVFVS
jgi:hypothetical protein